MGCHIETQAEVYDDNQELPPHMAACNKSLDVLPEV